MSNFKKALLLSAVLLSAFIVTSSSNTAEAGCHGYSYQPTYSYSYYTPTCYRAPVYNYYAPTYRYGYRYSNYGHCGW